MILLAMPLLIADLFTNEIHPADIWIANVKVLLLIAAAVWTALMAVFQKDKK